MTAATRPPRAHGLARLGTDALQPATWILAVTIVTGWHAGRVAGVGWGLLGALFAAVIPVAWIRRGTRKGTISGQHVYDRRHRIGVMIFILCSVAAGIALMVAFGSPRLLIAVSAAMLVTLAGLLAVTTKWKISVHSAVSAGATAMLALACGPALLGVTPLVALTCWSRVVLRDHTTAQVIAGAALGAAFASAAFLAVR